MRKIALISDTHGYIDEKMLKYLREADEIWHAGDIGSEHVLETLKKLKPTRIVFGNIDSHRIRTETTEHLRFMCEDVEVWLTHIGGYPGKYAPQVKQGLKENPPKLFICGHSHILKVQYDKTLEMLHMNPGAAGKFGFHVIRTMMRFVIDGDQIKDLEVIELSQK